MIETNYRQVEENIIAACKEVGRDPAEVTLIAVSKTKPIEMLQEIYDEDIRHFGENKVQEFLLKEPELALADCNAHLIGHLQSNKVKKIVGKVDTIQSVDSVAIAQEIGKRSAAIDFNTKILLEVNVGNEESKFGFSYDEVYEKACEISEIKGVTVNGLMCVAPICEKEAEIRAVFSNMYRLFIDIRDKKRDNINMNVLSMGMSGDYKEAISEGANLIRVGSSIFGSRIYR